VCVRISISVYYTMADKSSSSSSSNK
jgi:hypothetical protein